MYNSYVTGDDSEGDWISWRWADEMCRETELQRQVDTLLNEPFFAQIPRRGYNRTLEATAELAVG